MCRHASWVQLGTPLKTRPTGTFHLSLEYTDDSINFLLHPNKFPHLRVETKNRVFLFRFFFFLRLCSLWKKQRLSPSSLLSLPCCQNPLRKKKKKNATDSLVFLAAFAFSPLFPPIKKTKISRHWDDATECWESVLRSAHLRAPRCFAASR